MTEAEKTESATKTVAIAGSALILGLALTVVAMIAFAGIAFGLGAGWFELIDNQVLAGGYWLRSTQSWLIFPMRFITEIGYFVGFTVQTLIVGAILIWKRPQRWRSSLIILTVAMVGTAVLGPILKEAWQRARPSLYETPLVEHTFSFPSGHALSAAVFYGTVVLIACRSSNRRDLYWMIALFGAFVAAWMGVSRLFFSVHYASDVLGGFVSGLAWLMAVVLLDQTLRWWQGRRAEPQIKARRTSQDGVK